MKIKFKVRKLKKNWKINDELVFTGKGENETVLANLARAGIKPGDKCIYRGKSYEHSYCEITLATGETTTIYILSTALVCYAKTTRTRKPKTEEDVNIEDKLEAQAAYGCTEANVNS